MKPVVKLYKLGRLSYQRALSAQILISDHLKKSITQQKNHDTRLTSQSDHHPNKLKSCITNSLLLVEHEPVYTVGIRTQKYDSSYVAKLEATLAKNNLSAEFHITTRGGLITFHGPGQLVAYPIINLNEFNKAIVHRSVKAYVKTLENIIIDTLAGVGLFGAHTLKQYPGVWMDSGQRKIAFIGISCKRFVTMHGLSINCDCDLSWFDHIISCGIEDKAITSVRQELLSSHKLEQQHLTRPRSDSVHHIAKRFCMSFSEHLNCDLVEEKFPWDFVANC